MGVGVGVGAGGQRLRGHAHARTVRMRDGDRPQADNGAGTMRYGAGQESVISGVDPERDWRVPLAWAADEASLRGVSLQLVVAVAPPHDTQHVDATPGLLRQAQEGEEALERAASWARERQPGVEVTTHLLEAAPASLLTELSENAGMLVLGSRHLRGPSGFLGTSALILPLAARARCPVAVVGHPEHSTQEPAYLVVGIDDSASSHASLDWAFQEAASRGCALRVVAAWQPSVFTTARGHSDHFKEERRALAEAVAGWAEDHPDVAVTHEVVEGSPVEVLAEAGEHALGLVVGRKGNGGYTGMRLGSVARGVLRRAHCPVIVVPPS